MVQFLDNAGCPVNETSKAAPFHLGAGTPMCDLFTGEPGRPYFIDSCFLAQL
jgi:hypothetical protein